jgi:CO/xanthine dehydrogenase Mo-binding subunit
LFSELPAVEVVLIDQPNELSKGVGEVFAGPTAAAISNAIFDAIGIRVRNMPITAERLISLINQ